MERVSVNDSMTIIVPNGFHVMDEAEKNAISGGNETKPAWCITDPVRHIIFTVSWKTVPKLVSIFFSSRDLARKMYKEYSQASSAAGYRFDELRDIPAGSLKAHGYRFSYNAKGTAMCGESASLKNGNTFYYLHSYFREELREESIKVLEEIYGSIQF